MSYRSNWRSKDFKDFTTNNYVPSPLSPTSLRYEYRAPSSLERSSELLSMEEELRELLKNSNLNFKQRRAFEEMLESTFDLFQTPLSKGTKSESLIDSSSVALYGKMQSLVSALTSLIINEEESTRIEEFDETHLNQKNNNSNEFSDDDDVDHSNIFGSNRKLPLSPNVHRSRISSPSTTTSLSRAPSITRLSSIRRSDSLNSQKKAPSFRSPNLPTFNDKHQEYSKHRYNLDQYEQSTNSHSNHKPDFQVLQTPIPRSFSQSTQQHHHQRPKSMYISNNPTSQHIYHQNQQSYSSPQGSTISSRRHSVYFPGYDESGAVSAAASPSFTDHGYSRSRRNSQASNISQTSRKRYSMRF